MITLCIDAAAALIEVTSRAVRAANTNLRLRVTPPRPVAAAEPAGADLSNDGTGGHPIMATSALLHQAALWIVLNPRHTAADEQFAARLRDRAEAFAGHGD